MPVLQLILMLAFTALLLVPLERLLPMHADQRQWRPGLMTDLIHATVSAGIIQLGMAATIAGIGIAVATLVPGEVGTAVRALPWWAQFVALLIVSDFMFYVAHWTVHKVPALWRFHTVHHSSERLDWIAAHRVHPVDQLFNGTLIALPGIALGFAPEILVTYALLYRWHALILHANVAIELGVLGKLITTPHFHHWHHARDAAAHDRNFGGQLALWDRLFGTVHAPAGPPAAYGIDQPVPADYLGQIVHPFRGDTAEAPARIVPARH